MESASCDADWCCFAVAANGMTFSRPTQLRAFEGSVSALARLGQVERTAHHGIPVDGEMSRNRHTCRKYSVTMMDYLSCSL